MKNFKDFDIEDFSHVELQDRPSSQAMSGKTHHSGYSKVVWSSVPIVKGPYQTSNLADVL